MLIVYIIGGSLFKLIYMTAYFPTPKIQVKYFQSAENCTQALLVTNIASARRGVICINWFQLYSQSWWMMTQRVLYRGLKWGLPEGPPVLPNIGDGTVSEFSTSFASGVQSLLSEGWEERKTSAAWSDFAPSPKNGFNHRWLPHPCLDCLFFFTPHLNIIIIIAITIVIVVAPQKS